MTVVGAKGLDLAAVSVGSVVVVPGFSWKMEVPRFGVPVILPNGDANADVAGATGAVVTAAAGLAVVD
jgi:hypothetical protein